MNVSLSANWNRIGALSAPATKPMATGNPAKNEKAARDFEAMLLAPVLDALQKTFSGGEDSTTPAASDYRQMGTQALAQSIAAAGGVGIAKLILQHLQSPKVPGA